VKEYQLEKRIGKVKITPYNLFVDSIDIQDVEYWEERFEKMGEPYTIAFKKDRHGQIVYSIFVASGRKNGVFKI
jgi:hypothetical protein